MCCQNQNVVWPFFNNTRCQCHKELLAHHGNVTMNKKLKINED